MNFSYLSGEIRKHLIHYLLLFTKYEEEIIPEWCLRLGIQTKTEDNVTKNCELRTGSWVNIDFSQHNHFVTNQTRSGRGRVFPHASECNVVYAVVTCSFSHDLENILSVP